MKDRRTLIYLVIISMFLISMMALIISAQTSEKTGAKAFVLYNPEIDSFIFGNNADLQLPMASTTKIMTALIAIEELDPDEKIEVPPESVGIEGSSIYLSCGDVITVRDLIYSVLLQSANDAATVLAIRIGGTIEGFASLMNDRAAKIGALNTNFENPHGLDSDNHYTTAKDLALITAQALKNDTFRKICSTYKYSFNIGDKTRVLVNHNKLLKQYEGCIGVKTGYTKKCGRCLVGAAYKDGVTLIAVTLSDPDDWRDHKTLFDLGFDTLEAIDLRTDANIPDSLPILAGNKESVKIGIKDTDRYFVRKKDDALPEISVSLKPYVLKSVKKGDVLGKITVTDKSITKEINIIALEDVKSKSNTFPIFGK